MNDELAIRELVETWLRASRHGDLETILDLMAEDVVFLVPGQPPMRGRDAFAEGFQTLTKSSTLEATGEIQEIQINGDWAYCWNSLEVSTTPKESGPTLRRQGPVLRSFVETRKANGRSSVTQTCWRRSSLLKRECQRVE